MSQIWNSIRLLNWNPNYIKQSNTTDFREWCNLEDMEEPCPFQENQFSKNRTGQNIKSISSGYYFRVRLAYTKAVKTNKYIH